MKLKNVLIAVENIEKSKQLYRNLFGLDMEIDNDGNMILTEGFVPQDEKNRSELLGGNDEDIVPGNKLCELYFEEQDAEEFLENWKKYTRQSNTSIDI